MIIREKYLSLIRGFYESDLVKVITGVRRCGKSVILESIMNEIKEQTDNIIYLNFEKTSDFVKASNYSKIIEYVNNNRKDGKCYCFFDEIQEIENWQIAIKDLRLENCSIFITGSNSKLLSSEFITLLSGRFVSFRIRPFVYREIQKLSPNTTVTDYLIWGGFPGRFVFKSEQDTRIYLNDIENTIVINDLIKRYKIKNETAFKKIVYFILSSNARIFSIRSIHQILKSDFPNIALTTVARFIEYLKNAYIIDEIAQFSTKTKRELRYYGKIYNCDVAFNSLGALNNRYDLDHNLENIVYNELLYMGYELKVFDKKGKAIDFLATRGGKTYLVQVAYSVVDEKAYNREFSAFSNIDNTNQKILITNDDIDFSTSTVRHLKLKDFLLKEDLE